MYKKSVSFILSFLMLFTIGCSNSKSKSTKLTSLDFSKVEPCYIIAVNWPRESSYLINDYRSCRNVMYYLKNMDFKVLEKPFEIEQDIEGNIPHELEIRTNDDLITITFHTSMPIVTYLKDDKKYYCEITKEGYEELYNTVLQYRPEDE